ncbi:hypothetical protein [Thiomicrorhabdus sp.]|uniref:hypothetical protein n=1 Tax=Thiomicrorhabdus sp. TaxID=2039724 RepID=UPI0029C690C0|nr:hypothetical protein [Thiomicrorhabdus sp.]
MAVAIESRLAAQQTLYGAESFKSIPASFRAEDSPQGSSLQTFSGGDDSVQISASGKRRAEQAYAYSNSMSLQLTTRDGDKVSVDFRQLYAYFHAEAESQQFQAGPQGVQYFSERSELESSAFSEAFGFSVEGELDEEELAAIQGVFEQVNALSEDFFDGNLDEALQHAMAFDIDFGQLQSLDLQLSHAEVRTGLYEETSRLNSPVERGEVDPAVDSAPKSTMQALPDYLQKWHNVMQQLSSLFSGEQDFVNQLEAQVLSLRDPQQRSEAEWQQRVEAFHQTLQSWAEIESPAPVFDEVSGQSMGLSD